MDPVALDDELNALLGGEDEGMSMGMPMLAQDQDMDLPLPPRAVAADEPYLGLRNNGEDVAQPEALRTSGSRPGDGARKAVRREETASPTDERRVLAETALALADAPVQLVRRDDKRAGRGNKTDEPFGPAEGVKEWSSAIQWKDARTEAKAYDGYNWRKGPLDNSKTGILKYTCHSHKNCMARIKLSSRSEDGEYAGAFLQVNGRETTSGTWLATPHATEFQAWEGKGMAPNLRSEVNLMRRGGATPLEISVDLHQKYKESGSHPDKEKALNLPSGPEVQSHLGVHMPASRPTLMTALDLMARYATCTVTSWSDVEKVADADAPLVLANFASRVNVRERTTLRDGPDVDLGQMIEKQALATTFGSRQSLSWLRDLVMSQEGGARGYVKAVSTDGTYRLVRGHTASGAVLVDLGVYTISYDATRDIETQPYMPLLLQYTQTECKETYMSLFETFRDIPKKVFGLPDVILKPQFGSLDRSSAIANAFHEVWPEEG